MNYLPQEIIRLITHECPSSDLFRLGCVSKYYYVIIRSVEYYGEFKPKTNDMLVYVYTNYKFRNINLYHLTPNHEMSNT